MNRIALAAILFPTVTSLGACKAGVDANFFTSDVVAVARDGAPIDVTVTVSVDALTAEKCAENKDVIGAALRDGFSDVKFVECRQGDMTTFAAYRVAVPMVKPDTKTDGALAFWAGETAGQIGVALKPDLARIDKIIATLPNDVQSGLSGKLEPMISLTLQNDLSGPATVKMHGAFVDGDPYQLPTDFEVERRDELRIVLSDVGNAAFYNGGSLMFFLNSPE